MCGVCQAASPIILPSIIILLLNFKETVGLLAKPRRSIQRPKTTVNNKEESKNVIFREFSLTY